MSPKRDIGAKLAPAAENVSPNRLSFVSWLSHATAACAFRHLGFAKHQLPREDFLAAFREIPSNKAVTIALQRHDNTALSAG